MSGFLIPITVLSFAINAAGTRAFQLKFPGKRGLLRLYQSFYCLVSAIAFGSGYFAGGGAFDITASESISGALFGLFFFLAVVGAANGYELGSMSLTAIILNMSLFIPLVYSCVMFGDELSGVRIIGIILIAATMISAVGPNGKKADTASEAGSKSALKWFSVVFIAFIANGMTAVIQKQYAVDNGSDKMLAFMSIAYITASLLFFASSMVTKRSSGEALPKNSAIIIFAAIVAGLGSFGGNALLGYLCDKVNSTILYPCVNGGLCIVSSLVSFVFFGEPISKRKIATIAAGISAIILLNL